MSDVPIGDAARTLPAVVARARQAEQTITVNGEPAAVVVDSRRYAVMKKTLEILSNRELAADLEGPVTGPLYGAGDLAEMVLRRCTDPVTGSGDLSVIHRCQQLLDTLSPSYPTAEMAPIHDGIDEPTTTRIPATHDLEALWSATRDPSSPTDYQQFENSGDMKLPAAHTEPTVERTRPTIFSDDERRRSLIRVMKTSTAMRAFARRRDEE